MPPTGNGLDATSPLMQTVILSRPSAVPGIEATIALLSWDLEPGEPRVQRMKKLCLIAALLGTLFSTACTTQIHQDYPQYLGNNQGRTTYPHVADSVSYYLDPATENHQVKIRSFMAGAANSWIVQFGRILDATMQGSDIRTAFDSVAKSLNPDGTEGLVLIFQLVSYQFEGFQTTLVMRTRISQVALIFSAARKRFCGRGRPTLLHRGERGGDVAGDRVGESRMDADGRIEIGVGHPHDRGHRPAG